MHADTFDAYVATSDAVKVIDFNPVGGTTSPLLFSWQELGWAQGLAEPRENGAAAEAALAAHGGGASGADGLEDQLGGRQQEVNGHRQQVGQGAAVPLVRIVDGPHSIQPGERSACAMPFDMLMLGSHGAGDAAAAQEMISFMQRRP